GELEDEIDRTALLNDVRVLQQRFERERPQAKNPGFWLTHLPGGRHFLLGRRDRAPAGRARALAGRLEDVPGLLDDARAALVEPVRVFVETALRITEGGLALVRDMGTAVDGVAPSEAGRLAAAAEKAGAALSSFAHDLGRWLESASDRFALGEDDFNFHLHYEHALRDTAPELWRYGMHLKEELEADLARRAARFDGGKRWQDVADRLRADHCRYELAATALHEGYPGHHLQLLHAQAQSSDTRKNVWTPLTVEGWALYCEDMMGEEGFYRSEEEAFFQRVHLLWRATRVLLDVGLHTRGMTFGQAVDPVVIAVIVDPANA